jgi:L-histidine Nalpha-methyltransferase
MRTEVSAKFRQTAIAANLAATGFAIRSWWTDTDTAGRFGLSLSVPA